MKTEIEFKEMVAKTVKPMNKKSSAGYFYLPKQWIGRQVKVFYCEEENNDKDNTSQEQGTA